MQTKCSFCISRTPGWVLLVLLSSLLFACDQDQEQAQNNNAAMVPTTAGDELLIYTVNYPLAYFAERIGAEDVNVVFPVPDLPVMTTFSPGRIVEFNPLYKI